MQKYTVDAIVSAHAARSGLSRREALTGLLAVAAAVGFLDVRSANAAGTINFLGWEEQGSDEIFGEWAKKNDVTIKRSFINENEEIVQKLLAGGLGLYDVLNPDIQHSKGFIEQGLYQSIAIDKLPSFKQVHPYFQNLVAGYGGAPTGETYIVPNTWGMWALLYRADKVPEPPQSWGDLLDPKYKGKIAVNDDFWAQITIFSLLKGFGASYPNLSRAQLDEVTATLIELKKNARTMTNSFADASDLLIRGDVWLATPGWPAMVAPGKERGIDVKYTVPKEGTGSWLDNFALANKAPNPELGVDFINYGISADAQTRAASKLTGIVNVDAINALPPDLKSLYPYDDIDGFYKKAPFAQLPPLKRTDGDVMTVQDWLKAWEDVKQA